MNESDLKKLEGLYPKAVLAASEKTGKPICSFTCEVCNFSWFTVAGFKVWCPTCGVHLQLCEEKEWGVEMYSPYARYRRNSRMIGFNLDTIYLMHLELYTRGLLENPQDSRLEQIFKAITAQWKAEKGTDWTETVPSWV